MEVSQIDIIMYFAFTHRNTCGAVENYKIDGGKTMLYDILSEFIPVALVLSVLIIPLGFKSCHD
jgi:hypothetical protein